MGLDQTTYICNCLSKAVFHIYVNIPFTIFSSLYQSCGNVWVFWGVIFNIFFYGVEIRVYGIWSDLWWDGKGLGWNGIDIYIYSICILVVYIYTTSVPLFSTSPLPFALELLLSLYHVYCDLMTFSHWSQVTCRQCKSPTVHLRPHIIIGCV